jgi:uncharacterized membrane protein YhiD involved in acid resistance
MNLSEPFNQIAATAVAALLGAAIGAERGWRRHPGGQRSAAPVASAASAFAQITPGVWRL